LTKKGNGVSTAFSICLACGVLALAITDSLLNGQAWLQTINVETAQALSFNGDRGFHILMIALSIAGSDAVLYLIALGAAGWLWRITKREEAMVLLCSALAARIVVSLVKVAVGASRPLLKSPPWPLTEVYDFGYPSGHALMSCVILGFISILILRSKTGTFPKAIFTASLWIVILSIGFSRIYLGYHWLNDVVGGVVYGLVILLIANGYSRSDREAIPATEAFLRFGDYQNE
jgi:membrane-associated phospholipid phosphatase